MYFELHDTTVYACCNLVLGIFAQPFVKRFALCYRSVVLSVCLFVTLEYCCQTVVWIKMKLDMEVRLGPGHNVLDGDSAPPQRGTVHVCCGRTAGWIKMPLGTKVGLGRGDIVSDRNPEKYLDCIW